MEAASDVTKASEPQTPARLSHAVTTAACHNACAAETLLTMPDAPPSEAHTAEDNQTHKSSPSHYNGTHALHLPNRNETTPGDAPPADNKASNALPHSQTIPHYASASLTPIPHNAHTNPTTPRRRRSLDPPAGYRCVVTVKELLIITNETNPSNDTNLDSVFIRAIRLHS